MCYSVSAKVPAFGLVPEFDFEQVIKANLSRDRDAKPSGLDLNDIEVAGLPLRCVSTSDDQ